MDYRDLVSPLVTPIILPDIMPYETSFKDSSERVYTEGEQRYAPCMSNAGVALNKGLTRKRATRTLNPKP